MFDRWALMKRNEFLEKQNEELEAEKKALMEENEELKEMLESTRHDLFYTREQNRFLSESLADLQNEKRKDLEKRVADLEEQLAKKAFLLDDKGTPIKSFTLTGKLTVMNEPTEEKLEIGKWYHTTDFTKEKLTELLPKGTPVEVEREALYDNIEKEPPTKTTTSKVLAIKEGLSDKDPLINIGSLFNKEWFKIIEE